MRKPLAAAGLVVGLAIVIALVAWRGVGTITALLAAGGPSLLLLVLASVPSLLLGAWSWRLLFSDDLSPGFARILRIFWVGASINNLLPVASIGGEVARARLLVREGVEGTYAVASVVVDKLLAASTLVTMTLVGGALLALVAPTDDLIMVALLSAIVLALALAVAYRLQRIGPFALLAASARRAAGKGFGSDVSTRFESIDDHVAKLLSRTGALAGGAALRLASRLSLSIEIWIAAWLMGQPIGIAEAVLIKSLSLAVRGSAFFVPSGLGVQEATFILLGSVSGVGPDVMLAISLASRGREVLTGLPGLIDWHRLEIRKLVSASKRKVGSPTQP